MIATKLANTDDLAIISEANEAEIREAHSNLERYIESIKDDCRQVVNNIAVFNELHYEWVDARYNCFASSLEERQVTYGEDRAKKKAAIEN